MLIYACVHACVRISVLCVCVEMCECGGWVVSAQLCRESYSQEPRMVILMPSLLAHLYNGGHVASQFWQ